MNDKLYFEDFLQNTTVYDQNEAWWEHTIQSILMPYSVSYLAYITPRFRNGKKFYNGNPMFNAYHLARGRAFKIIQQNPKEAGHLPLTAWVDKVEIDDTIVEELVISTVLSAETATVIRHWVKAWFVYQLPKAAMVRLLDNVIAGNLADETK